ncbi:GGDEF domain-containing protein [Frankia sp. CNm7]|uniref:GGDEF domain-containing protein n=1 Tax=Frankia nepalensis TaxID=1836974 RepID=A0A937UPI7_9ACTN|nr:GGDEF domain-containing protein [Frankia nepalensis]MBL7499700.1 GGDEF domain-containing protein [Frankia nepalensis]MBL7515008.1 GGDEF domain-containing protein [Frankia nepalensis]MBL7521314.1 GGDEF domain-containing protein [Frankia nepalensis]MBL7629132.1 GGDEF domain-containing protein [Frankia nepalensis]
MAGFETARALGPDASPQPDAPWNPTVARRLVVTFLLAALAALGAAMALPQQEATLLARVCAGLACLVAAVVGAWSGWRCHGPERGWRLLLALCFAAEVPPNLALARAPSLTGGVIPGVSTETALYLALLVVPVKLAALLMIPTRPLAAPDGAPPGSGLLSDRRWRLVVVLDSLLVVGAVLLLVWIWFGPAASAQTPLFALMGSLGGVKLAMLVLVLLLASFRQPRRPGTFAFIAAGFIAYELSSVLLTASVVHGWSHLPILTAGLVAGPLLISLACLTPAEGEEPRPTTLRPGVLWLHTALPYLPLAVIAVVLPTQSHSGVGKHFLIALLLAAALVRLLVSLADNSQLLARVRYAALHDPLTGLANRTLLTEGLTRALARRGRGHRPVALLFCDLDDFKKINDSLGHSAGDQLLRTTADRLTSTVPASDIVARIGGDEFAMLLTDEAENPEAVARRVVATIREPVSLSGTRRAVHASAGLAVVAPGSGPITPDILMHRADLAMYAAKRSNKGDVAVYPLQSRAAAPGAAGAGATSRFPGTGGVPSAGRFPEPDGAHPDGTCPDGAHPDGAHPDGTRPDGAAVIRARS